MSRSGQADDEPTSSEDSVVLSLRMEPTRRLTNKQKGKVMMLKYDTCKDKLNRDESNYEKNEDGFCLALWIELETFNLQHWLYYGSTRYLKIEIIIKSNSNQEFPYNNLLVNIFRNWTSSLF